MDDWQQEPRPTIEPEGIFDGLSLGAILYGAVIDNIATMFSGLFLLTAFVDEEAIGDDGELAPEVLQQMAGTPEFLLASLAIGMSCTVLGAYLGAGTTVMHEGFINFNAGTEGPGMVEGRISAGVMVGKGSDLGGGCSTMGTLSGGGNIIISVGEECLIGANAGLGIPLGDRCTIEAGLFVTAGTKVAVLDDARKIVETVAARDLAGRSDLLFRRNSLSGSVECLTNKTAIELNESLHANN